MHKVVQSNWGNMWVGLILCGGVSAFIFFSAVYKNILNPDFIAISLLCWVPVIWLYFFLKFESVILNETAITHTKLGFFKKNIKTFRWEEIEYYTIKQLALVVVKKGSEEPNLPVGPLKDLSGVLLIPTSAYMPRRHEIINYLNQMGVHNK